MENVKEMQEMNEATTEQTAEQIKAAAILRARLPKLSAHSLNFEKRTGNFFRAVVEMQDDGTEKLSRRVLEDSDIPNECADEMQAKRAAAFLVGFNAAIGKATAKIDTIKKELETAKAEHMQLLADYNEAVVIVTACELPERTERVKLSEKVSEQANEIERLRALLAAAGIEA